MGGHLILPRRFTQQPPGPAFPNKAFLQPRHLWIVEGPYPVDVVGGAHAFTKANNILIKNGQSGRAVAGNGSTGTISGYETIAGAVRLDGLEAVTFFAVATLEAYSTNECAFMRIDNDADSSSTQIGFDIFPNSASSAVMRPLVVTSGTTGWTTSVDIEVGGVPLGIPYLFVSRWRNGLPIQSMVRPIGRAASVIWSGAYSPTGAITASGSGSLSMRMHIGGMANIAGASFPGSIYTCGILPYWITDPEVAALSYNPWQAFKPSPRKVWIPGAALPPETPANGKVIRRRERRTQPPQRVQLARRNKFAEGALSVFSGTQEQDLVTGAPLLRFGSGQTRHPAGQGVSAMGIRTKETGAVYARTPCSTGLKDFVLIWYGIVYSPSTAPAGNAYIAGNFDDTSGQGIAKRRSDLVGWGAYSGGNLIDSGEVLPEGKPVLLIFTENGQGLRLYRDGQFKASTTPPRVTDTSIEGWAIGSIRGDLSGTWGQDCLTFLTAKIQATWSPAMVAEYSRNPWQLLQHVENAVVTQAVVVPNTAEGNASGTSSSNAVRGWSGTAGGTSAAVADSGNSGQAAGTSVVNAARGYVGTAAGSSSSSAQPNGMVYEGNAAGTSSANAVPGYVGLSGGSTTVTAVPAVGVPDTEDRICSFPIDDDLDFEVNEYESLS